MTSCVGCSCWSQNSFHQLKLLLQEPELPPSTTAVVGIVNVISCLFSKKKNLFLDASFCISLPKWAVYMTVTMCCSKMYLVSSNLFVFVICLQRKKYSLKRVVCMYNSKICVFEFCGVKLWISSDEIKRCKLCISKIIE